MASQWRIHDLLKEKGVRLTRCSVSVLIHAHVQAASRCSVQCATYGIRRHMLTVHGMPKEELDVATVANKRHQLPCNYWTQIYESQVSVVPKDSVVAAAPVTTTATPVSIAPTTAPPADTPGGDAL